MGIVIAAVAWAIAFTHADSPALAAGGLLLIVFGYALVLAAEFVVLHVSNRNDPTPAATLKQLVRAWLGEIVTGPLVFCWRQPFLSNTIADCLAAHDGRHGVVLVHGFLANRGLWNPLMKDLRRLGIPFIAVNLEPIFGSIDDYPHIIESAVTRLEASTGRASVIVAHSMGGLAVRAWLDAYQADHRVHRVITVGTPHRGTYLGRFAQSPNTRQMRLEDEWRLRLEAREPAQRLRGFTCFYGHCDNIVIPSSNATLPGADNRHLSGVAHVHMLYREEVFDEVLHWTAEANRSSAHS
jgi:triacylglycerol esterase/lipase EstA (alpha/beta hydrolase family)